MADPGAQGLGLWGLALLFVSGCVNSQSVAYETYEPYPKDHPIRVIVSKQAPVEIQRAALSIDPRAFTAPIPKLKHIGRIDLNSKRRGWTAILRTAADKARMIGGDAIALEKLNTGKDKTVIISAGNVAVAKDKNRLYMTVDVYRQIP